MNALCWASVGVALFLAGCCGWDIAHERYGLAALMAGGVVIQMLTLYVNARGVVLRARTEERYDATPFS